MISKPTDQTPKILSAHSQACPLKIQPYLGANLVPILVPDT